MADVDSAPQIIVRRSWRRRLATELLVFLVGLLLLAMAGLVVLDTAPGHRFIVDRIAALETASGLKIRIGRIDGSIFSETRLRNVTVSDPQGVFLTSPEILLDWSPGAWLYNNLHIDRLEAGKVSLVRLPRLKPSAAKGPILPGFDIHVGELVIRRLEVGRAVSGVPRVGSLRASGDIRAGRAMIDLQAAIVGGDRIAARLDAEPDRDRFDLGVRAVSPAGGLLPALFGSKRPLGLVIRGDGSWTRWRGSAALDLSGRPAARLALAADRGLYRLDGTLALSRYLKGRLQRLTAPQVRVRGRGRLADRVLDGEVTLASTALRAVARGALDLAGNEYKDVRVGIDLLRPQALYPTMRGRNVRMVWTLDGPFARATYAYRLTSPLVFLDRIGLADVRAEGKGKLTPWPLKAPIRLSAAAISGVGDVAGGILRTLKIEGLLEITPKLVRGDALKLTSDKLSGKASLLIDLVTGRFDLSLSGGLKRYLIPGLGIVDVETDLKLGPDPSGRGSRLTGTARAAVRRLDNEFFRSLAGGLPRLTTDLVRGPDGILRFSNLQLYAPALRLSGSGYRRADGTFHIEARGRQAKYGPLRLILDGDIARPRIDLLLDRPNEAMGLNAVRLQLVPTPQGFSYQAAGGSRLGPFTSTGQILLPRGAPVTIAVARLAVAGTVGSGTLRALPGGIGGRLVLAGGGLDGTLDFAPHGAAQRIEAHLAANGFSGGGIAMRSGRVDGTIVLAEGRTSLDGVLSATGFQSGAIRLARLQANGRLVNGSGEVRFAAAGQRGAAFDLAGVAAIAPDRIVLNGKGNVAGRPLLLQEAAVLTRVAGGWSLAPTRIAFGGGRARVSGRTGAVTEVRAELARMPLQLLDIIAPRTGLGGLASGTLTYASAGAGRTPSGRLDLKIKGLSRAGLVLSSKPIDVALAAVLADGRAGLRAVAGADGRVIGRAQARFAPLGNGPIVAALLNAPLAAQLRYVGPADTLWRLSGVEVFDLAGPISVGADLGGRLVDPRIVGSIRADNARIESAVTGTVIERLAVRGAFSGSRLALSSLSGSTPGGGSIAGSGTVDFAAGAPALDLNFQAQNARLLDRDDIAASVTGPLAVRSSGRGGTISGQLRLNGGRFTLGQASAAAKVPQLAVRHVGRAAEEDIEVAQLAPWALDIKAAGGPLTVTGLGIDSRWRTDLTIGGSVDAPRFTGAATLIRGDYEFAGRSFRLDRGVIRFRGESPPDPALDIRAEAQIQGLNASVNVTGTGQHPEITFASVPALPQDELLSRLLFGTSITNLSAPEALQLASAVAALRSGSGGLDPINAVRRAVGLDRLRILPADIATGQKTAISAGKYLGRKLFVEVITDGQGYSATRVEYQVTRWLSLLSSISTIGRTSANVRVSKDY